LKNDPDIFSGLIWTGEEGVALGLVDGLGSSDYVAREVIHEKEIVDFTPRQDVFQRFAKKVGASAAKGLLGAFVEMPGLR
jgi:protease-4